MMHDAGTSILAEPVSPVQGAVSWGGTLGGSQKRRQLRLLSGDAWPCCGEEAPMQLILHFFPQ